MVISINRIMNIMTFEQFVNKKVWVIIPTYEREKVFKKCIEYIDKNFPKDYLGGVIVVIQSDYEDLPEFDGLHFVKHEPGLPLGIKQRNFGYEEFKNKIDDEDFLLFIDDDVLYDDGEMDIKEVIRLYDEEMENPGVISFNKDINSDKKNSYETAQVGWTNLGMFLKKKVFEDIGMFGNNPKMDDAELFCRSLRKGYKNYSINFINGTHKDTRMEGGLNVGKDNDDREKEFEEGKDLINKEYPFCKWRTSINWFSVDEVELQKQINQYK